MIVRLARRNLSGRALTSALTLFAVALSAAGAVFFSLAARGTEGGLAQTIRHYDMIVGAKGSPLQLVLNAAFFQDEPLGNIDRALYEELKGDPRVVRAIPLGLGDRYQGYRIVGTTEEYFAFVPSGYAGASYRFAKGRAFRAPFEAVVGSTAAGAAGLTLGDRFVAVHGVVPAFESEEHEHHPYTVVGILEPTGTPVDLAIFTPMESVWLAHGSEATVGDVTAVLVSVRDLGGLYRIYQEINAGAGAQAVFPAEVLAGFADLFGSARAVLSAISGAVVAFAALAVALSMYSAGVERRRELATLRALGAPRGWLLATTLTEGFLICSLGTAGGLAGGYAGFALLSRRVLTGYGVTLQAALGSAEGYAALSAAAAGLCATLGAALAAYRTDPAVHLR